jgi:hypothetical protein
VPSEPEFDPLPLIDALSSGDVDFVVIGGVAGGAHGSAYGTFDLDVAYARDRANLERLASVLHALGATLRGDPAGLPFQPDAKTLEAGAHFTFATPNGSLDILSDPEGAPAYAELKRRGLSIDVRGRRVRVASLDDLIAMKEASGRPKDKLMATELRGVSDTHRAPRDESS